MKLLDVKGLNYLLKGLREILNEKIDKKELPKNAKFTGVVSGEKEPAGLKVGDEWQREKAL